MGYGTRFRPSLEASHPGIKRYLQHESQRPPGNELKVKKMPHMKLHRRIAGEIED